MVDRNIAVYLLINANNVFNKNVQSTIFRSGTLIGHFRVPKPHTFKMRPSAQPCLWKWILFAWERKIMSISKAEPLTVKGSEARGNSEMTNRPLPNSKNPHFQNEPRCTTFLAKMSFICMRMKNDFHIKGWAPTLVLKQRPRGIRKWSIGLQSTINHFARDTGLVLCRIAPWACFGTLTPLSLTNARLRRRLGQNFSPKTIP